MIFRSIKAQLQLWHCAVPSLLFFILLVVFYQHQRNAYTQNIDLELQTKIPVFLTFAEQVVALSSHNKLSDVEREPFIIEEDFHLRVFSLDGGLLWKSANAPELPYPEVSGQSKVAEICVFDGYREVVYVTPQSTLIAFGTSNETLSAQLTKLRLQLIWLALGLICMGWTVGYFIVSRALRPLETISQTAHCISSGKRGQRIDVDETKNELGTLAAVLNESFERQDAAFDQQVQFLADASHELRTPISIILAKSQLGQLYSDPERCNAALRMCEDAAKHMRDLIESLLDLSRLDSGVFELHKSSGNLAKTAMDAVNFIRPLAEEKGVAMQTDLGNAPAEFDQQRMRQVFINILSNAIKYNLAVDGWIKITGKAESEHYVVRVQNCGKTISTEDLPYLFDRFYRADKSRTKSREGSAGLGLAITKAIVEAHGGRISAESSDEVTVIQLVLPTRV